MKVQSKLPFMKEDSNLALNVALSKYAYRPGESVLAFVEVKHSGSRNPQLQAAGSDLNMSFSQFDSKGKTVLVRSLAVEAKGIEKLDPTWIKLPRNALPQRGEKVILKSNETVIASDLLLRKGITKTYCVKFTLPKILPPSYRGTSLKYHYTFSATLKWNFAELEQDKDGLRTQNSSSSNKNLFLDHRIPIKIWTFPDCSGLNEEEIGDEDHYGVGGIVPQSPVEVEFEWKDGSSHSSWNSEEEEEDSLTCEESSDAEVPTADAVSVNQTIASATSAPSTPNANSIVNSVASLNTNPDLKLSPKLSPSPRQTLDLDPSANSNSNSTLKLNSRRISNLDFDSESNLNSKPIVDSISDSNLSVGAESELNMNSNLRLNSTSQTASCVKSDSGYVDNDGNEKRARNKHNTRNAKTSSSSPVFEPLVGKDENEKELVENKFEQSFISISKHRSSFMYKPKSASALLFSKYGLRENQPNFLFPPSSPLFNDSSFNLSRGKTFNIRMEDDVIVRFTPRNPQLSFSLGDTVSGILSFPQESSARKCLEVFVMLETHEIINPKAVHASRRNVPIINSPKGAVHLPQVQTEFHEVTANMLSTHFIFSIAMDAPAAFATPLVSLQWLLRFEFVVSVPPSPNAQSSWLSSTQSKTQRVDWSIPITVTAPLPRIQTNDGFD